MNEQKQFNRNYANHYQITAQNEDEYTNLGKLFCWYVSSWPKKFEKGAVIIPEMRSAILKKCEVYVFKTAHQYLRSTHWY